MLNLLMLSLEETLLQSTKSLIHIGKHVAMDMKICLYYPCSSCINNGVFLYIITDNLWYIDALGISHA